MTTNMTAACVRTRRAAHIIRQCQSRVQNRNITQLAPSGKLKQQRNHGRYNPVAARARATIYGAVEWREHSFCFPENNSKISGASRSRRRGADAPSKHLPCERAWSLYLVQGGEVGEEVTIRQNNLLPGYVAHSRIALGQPPHPLGKGTLPRHKPKSQLLLPKFQGVRSGPRPPKRCPSRLHLGSKYPQSHAPFLAPSRFQVSRLKTRKAEASHGTTPYSPST